ncbi:MAG: DUF1848 domain-containing protein [Rhodospirillales bacterium]
MIVSASYKTDIPAFYGEWFINRLKAGYCCVRNPYGSGSFRVSLLPEDVDGIVFWTRNIGPFLPRLPEVRRRGIPFVVQYTINSYPRALDAVAPDAARSIEHMRALHGEYGPRVAVWRYDTIVSSSITPPDFHLRNFERIARALEGITDEVVVSFAQIYRKTRLSLGRAARKAGFTWDDPPAAAKRALLSSLAECARSRGMKLTVCGQREFLSENIADASCIDPARLSDVAGRPIRAPARAHRKDCGCYQSRDIGEYDTCPHGCVYCYAVGSQDRARRRYRAHVPGGEFLFTEVSS